MKLMFSGNQFSLWNLSPSEYSGLLVDRGVCKAIFTRERGSELAHGACNVISGRYLLAISGYFSSV